MHDLRFRHGLAPGAQNIRNVRHKVDPVVEKSRVEQVEVILKSLIETGFADNCDEELLEFDEDGKLVKVTPGVTEDQRQQLEADAVFAYKDGFSASDIDAASVSQSQFGMRQQNRSAVGSELNADLASESAANIYATPSKQTPHAQVRPYGFDSEMQGEESKNQHLLTAPAQMEGGAPFVAG